MAYEEQLAGRIRAVLKGWPHRAEKQMVGGVAFLRKGLMFAGLSDNALMARIGKDAHADALRRPHVRPMDFTGRPMQGYVFIDPAGLRTAAQLRAWLDQCERFVATLPAEKTR
jgi:TfoX/Sxy family transcriptional regulator of competence genes